MQCRRPKPDRALLAALLPGLRPSLRLARCGPRQKQKKTGTRPIYKQKEIKVTRRKETRYMPLFRVMPAANALPPTGNKIPNFCLLHIGIKIPMKINKNIILLTLFLLFLAALPGGLVAVCGGALRRFFGAWFGSLRCAGGEEEKEPPSQPPITKNIKQG